MPRAERAGHEPPAGATVPPRMRRSSIDGLAAATMLALCATWGAQQVAIKLAAPDVPPLVQVALRFVLSTVLVAGFMAWRRVRPSFGRTWRPGLLAGTLFAVEFLLIAEGLRHTSAGHMAVFLYSAPVFTAVGLHLLVPAERLRRTQWLGILVAFAGIAVAFLGDPRGGAAAARTSAWGDVLGVLAGALWGATTVVVRTTALSEAPAAETLLYQLAVAAVLLPPAAAFSTDPARLSFTPVAWASVLFQGIVVSFASYLTWFSLLRRYLATGLAVFSFMTPIFGVVFGVIVLGEPLTPAFLAGAALVLAGITVVSGVRLGRPRG